MSGLKHIKISNLINCHHDSNQVNNMIILNGEHNVISINYNSRALLISVSDSQLIIIYERS
jgi:hypothetical protein